MRYIKRNLIRKISNSYNAMAVAVSFRLKPTNRCQNDDEMFAEISDAGAVSRVRGKDTHAVTHILPLSTFANLSEHNFQTCQRFPMLFDDFVVCFLSNEEKLQRRACAKYVLGIHEFEFDSFVRFVWGEWKHTYAYKFSLPWPHGMQLIHIELPYLCINIYMSYMRV